MTTLLICETVIEL